MQANLTPIPDDPVHLTTEPEAGDCPGHVLPKRKDEIALEVCECLIDIASALFALSSKELRKAGRTSQPVSRVRQIAMYVAHVVLRMTMSDVGRGFGRDRTTVMHACQTIEDLRDDPEFDRVVHMFEQIASAAFRSRLGF
ncbi:helix-turn-helix domain-containing protein [Aquamicrobium ahrensii]|uniref:Chromosomal replication initiation ATPase DnaA n=1 Tax=Aquamicrobium ahrensii TaxID=469551 RepID=A0ABV2KNJ0_9HYPH